MVHHLVVDGWSIGVLLQDLVTVYRSLRAGEPLPLTPLPLQYADYGLWHRQQLVADTFMQQRAYWQQQLLT